MTDFQTDPQIGTSEEALAALGGVIADADREAGLPPVTEPEPEAEPEREEADLGDEPETPAPEEPEPKPAAETEDPLGNYLGKYGLTRETFAELPEEAQKAIAGGAEGERYAGRLAAEMGDLRRAVEQQSDMFSVDDDLEPDVRELDVGSIEELVNEGKFQEAATEAALAGNARVFNKVMQTWSDEDAYGSTQFLVGLQAMQEREERERELAPMREAAQQQQLNKNWSAVRKDLPGLDEHAEGIQESLVEVYGDNPAQLRQMLSSEKGETVIRNAYYMALGKSGAIAQPHVARQAADEAEAARLDAAVTTSTNRKAPAPKKDADAEVLAEIKEALSGGVNVQTGLVRDTR